MKRRFPERLSLDLLRRALSAGNPAMEQHFAEVSVLEAWSKVLGPLARYTEQLSFRDGTLYVHVVSATLRNDLFLQRSSLMQRVNDAIGRRLLFRIVFR
ncbi:MAG: DUF721 domain-containing protein [Paludibacteraceae bacterium]